MTNKDDYDWGKYHTTYSNQQERISKKRTQILKNGDYEFDGKSLGITKDILPLHPNWRLLYETILQLQPGSILECGCGWGDHMANIKVLMPSVEISGNDISEKQINHLKDRHPNLANKVEVLDITKRYVNCKYDIVYTQAVLMHLNTYNNWIDALINIFKSANKYVILMENWNRHGHNYMDAIKSLNEWDDIKFYFRRSPELGNKPHLMVISKADLSYEILDNYKILC